jgi:hypothetical protein
MKMVKIKYWVRYGLCSGDWEYATFDKTPEEVQKILNDNNNCYVTDTIFGSEARIIET